MGRKIVPFTDALFGLAVTRIVGIVEELMD
jgi:hypothetical protein